MTAFNDTAVTIAQTIAAGKYSDGEINLIINGIKEYRRRKSFVVKAAFRNGDKVEFTTRSGLTMSAVVVKIMPKNIRVRDTNGRCQEWNVSPQLLTKVA